MAWREDPLRSFKAAIAALIMSLYFGCAAGFAGFLGLAATFFGLLAGVGAASGIMEQIDFCKSNKNSNSFLSNSRMKIGRCVLKFI